MSDIVLEAPVCCQDTHGYIHTQLNIIVGLDLQGHLLFGCFFSCFSLLLIWDWFYIR